MLYGSLADWRRPLPPTVLSNPTPTSHYLTNNPYASPPRMRPPSTRIEECKQNRSSLKLALKEKPPQNSHLNSAYSQVTSNGPSWTRVTMDLGSIHSPATDNKAIPAYQSHSSKVLPSHKKGFQHSKWTDRLSWKEKLSSKTPNERRYRNTVRPGDLKDINEFTINIATPAPTHPPQVNVKNEALQLPMNVTVDEHKSPLRSHKTVEDYLLKAKARSSRKGPDKSDWSSNKSRSQQQIPESSTYQYMTSTIRSHKFISDQDIDLKPKVGDTFKLYETLRAPSTQLKKYRSTLQKPTRPSSRASTFRPTLCLSDFVLGPCKGQGAFGEVFAARHKVTGMLVAIKKIRKEKARLILQQFINELKIQLFLNHNNVVRLYGFFDEGSHIYTIMEYMEGGSLYSLLKQSKVLSCEEASRRLRQVCLGLKEMHSHSILHRDIKPQNIVITNDVCKLCDLGWAAVCKDRRTTYCGTLDYVSPQIIEGESYDESVDVWGVGVLAYEMMCGKAPFYHTSRKKTMLNIQQNNYETPKHLSTAAREFVQSILRHDPSQRLTIGQLLRHRFLAQFSQH